MRVLHLLKTSQGAMWAVRQMRELVRLGVEVHVVMPGNGPQIDRCRGLGIHVHPQQFDFPVRQPWRLPAVLRGIRRLVRETQPDLIHSHFVGTTLAMRMALGSQSAIPRIFQVPGPLHLERGPFGTLEVALAGPPDHWIASCAWTRAQYLARGLPRDCVSSSCYGTDIQDFAAEPGKLRRELGVSPDTRLVGMVAYMYPPKYYLGQFRGLKGHEDFLNAMALVQQHADCLAVVTGAQWGRGAAYERRLRRKADRLLGDRALFLGLRPDIPSIYADLDVAVHPSLSENLGGAAESMLAGVPTVATRVGGLPDLVRDPDTGWLVPPRSPQRLANAILQALRDPDEANRRALRGQALATKTLDVRRTAAEVFDLYHRVLKGNRGGCEKECDWISRRAA